MLGGERQELLLLAKQEHTCNSFVLDWLGLPIYGEGALFGRLTKDNRLC
jgi:hypothetical protein